jgi:DNA-binding NarL/FixJ family response regulator
MTDRPIRVLFIDDNRLLAAAFERRLKLEPTIQYAGWSETSHQAHDLAKDGGADVILLDIDMPGDSFEVVRQLATQCPDVRVIMFSGYVRSEFIDKALDAGAWGYVSKNEGIEVVIDAIRRVASGEFVLSPDVESERPGRV